MTSAREVEHLDNESGRDTTGIGEIQVPAGEEGKPEIAVPGVEVTISQAA